MREKVPFVDMMSEDRILLGVEGNTKEEVLRKVADVLLEKGFVKETYYDALLQREDEYPTGLPIGELNLAIPHTYPEHINDVAITLCIPKNPVVFHQMGDPSIEFPVHVMVCLTMKKMEANAQMFPTLLGFFADEDNLKTLRSMTDPKEVMKFIRENA